MDNKNDDFPKKNEEENFSLPELLSCENDKTPGLSKINSNLSFKNYYENRDVQKILLQTDCHSINLNPKVIQNISKKMALHFSGGNEELAENNSSPVCYAASPEVSDEFRLEVPPASFSARDILDYASGILNDEEIRRRISENEEADSIRIPYPKNQLEFWRIASKGKSGRA